MPGASPSYCRKTPVKAMGFTQRASCKAQGIIARADGTRRKSKKYLQRGLFSDSKTTGKKQYGYGTPDRARDTIRYLKDKPLGYKLRLATSMYNRAKYHANQTADMRKSMVILGNYIKKLKNK
jgi:hypothetical protein